MKRILIIALLLFAAAGMVFAQEFIGGTGPLRIELRASEIHVQDTGMEMVQEVSVEKFETEGFWFSRMSSDDGYAVSRLFRGGPMDKEPIEAEEDLNIPDDFVLGTRVDYLRRGHHTFFIRPIRPIPIEGITKEITMWVAGRNFNHDIVLLVQDYFGRDYEIYMGKVNHQGWKQLRVAIPPQSADGVNGVNQRSYHYNHQMGIKITGFKIVCDPVETYGSYYIYFDDLRALTDLSAELLRDEDDMADGW